MCQRHLNNLATRHVNVIPVLAIGKKKFLQHIFDKLSETYGEIKVNVNSNLADKI